MLRAAISPAEVAELNAQIDALNPAHGQAMGLTHAEAKCMMADPHSPAGKEVQQGFGTPAGGVGLGSHPCFDVLIDHPSWIHHIKDFTDGAGTRLKSRFGVMERWPGQASGIHGGRMVRAPEVNKTFQWREEEEGGAFHCQQVSVLLSLSAPPAARANVTAPKTTELTDAVERQTTARSTAATPPWCLAATRAT